MLAVAIVIVSAAYLALGLAVLARRKPRYSHVRHTISEIGETGARDRHVAAFALFLPIGLALAAAAWVLHFHSSAAAALALAIAIGYLGAAAFPCDPGSPLRGSARQWLHNLAGGIEYVGGGLALMTLARGFGRPLEAAGFVVFGAAFALSALPSASVRGLVQRIAEACLFAGLAWSAWRLAS